MLHIVSVLLSTLLLTGGMAMIAGSLLRDRHMVLRALGLAPSYVAVPAPLPPRVRMVTPRRLALRQAAALREAA